MTLVTTHIRKLYNIRFDKHQPQDFIVQLVGRTAVFRITPRICQFLVAGLLFAFGGQDVTAQTGIPPAKILDPQSVTADGVGWKVDPKNGYLGFTLPVATIPGDIPVPVVLRYRAAHIVMERPSGVDYYPYDFFDTPISASIDFGTFEGNYETYVNDITEAHPGRTVLEDGTSIDWCTNSGTPGRTFTLPQKFGFGAWSGDPIHPGGCWPPATVDRTGNYAIYSVLKLSDLGIWANKIPHPEGWGASYDNLTSPVFTIILSQSRARVYLHLGGGMGPVPVLWADRFGHYVTFKWKMGLGGSGYNSVKSVKIITSSGAGAILQWPDFSPTTVPVERDLARLDWIGMQAPGLTIKGYPNSNNSEFARPQGIHTRDDSAGPSYPYYRMLECRPTQIRMGNPSQAPTPIWPYIESIPSYPSESTWASDLIWSFTYNSNKSLVNSITDPRGVQTTFSYASGELHCGVNYEDRNYFMAVTQAVSLDTQTGKSKTQSWTRVFPHAGAWTCIASGIYSDGDNTGAFQTKYIFPTPGVQEIVYRAGLPLEVQTLSANGSVIGSVAYTYKATGVEKDVYGVPICTNPTVSNIVTTRAGEPTQTIVRDLDVTTGLAKSETLTVGGVLSQITRYTRETKLDLLIPGRVTEAAVSHYASDGTLTSSSNLTEYDSVTDLPTRTYLSAGGLKKGTNYVFDSTSGRLSSTSIYAPGYSGGENTQSFGYTTQGWLNSKTTTYLYGSASSQISESNTAFTTQGRPTSSSDAKGVTTTMSYDTLGRMLSQSRPGSPSVSTTYDPGGRSWSSRRSDGPTSSESSDGFGRLLSRARFDGVTETFSYDNSGRKTSFTESADGVSRTTATVFDGLGRAVSESRPGGISSSSSYSAQGRNQKITTTTTNRDGQSYTTYVIKDPWGKVIESTDPLGNLTKTDYDQFGNVTRTVTTDAASGKLQERKFSYNAIGFLTSRTEPETGTTSFSNHDIQGRARMVVDDKGADQQSRTRSLNFDGLGRLRSLSSGSDILSYSYDGAWLTSATNNGPQGYVSTTYQYNNPGGGLSQESTTFGGVTRVNTFTCDGEGHLTQMGYPSGRTVGYGYQNGRVSSVAVDGVALASAGYDGWGHLGNVSFASGTKDEWVYSQVAAKLRSWTTRPVGDPVEQRIYSYDANLNLQSISSDWTLSHDVMGHLLSATGYGHTETFVHDGFENNTSSVSTGTYPPTLNNFTVTNPLVDNRIPGIATNGAMTGWNTSARGEAQSLGSAISCPTVLSLGWDGLGRLSSASLSGQYGLSQAYTYAASGLRIQTRDSLNPANNRSYAYSGSGQLLVEYGSNGGWKRDVIYLNDLAIAEVDSNGIHELHSDHLGTPRIITAGPILPGYTPAMAAGRVEGRQAYAPYGELLTVPSLTNGYQPLTGYTGHIQTDATGLIYMRGRFYSPAWHRFVTSDQGADPAQSHQLAYAKGSPLQLTDPTGMYATDPAQRTVGDPMVDEADLEEKAQREAQTSDSTPDARGGPLNTSGSLQGIAAINEVLAGIRGSGEAGASFIKSVESSPVPIDIIDAKVGVAKDGTKVSPADMGGGFCWGPNQTKSGHVEVYVDTSMWGKVGGLGSYRTSDGKTTFETPKGLVSHELAHGLLRAKGDRTPQGPASENRAIRLTNPIRTEMGLQPQALY